MPFREPARGVTLDDEESMRTINGYARVKNWLPTMAARELIKLSRDALNQKQDSERTHDDE